MTTSDAAMTILAVGDVVGEESANWLASRLPAIRDRHDVTWVVVNAENCAVTGPSPMNGFGMTVEVVDTLLAAGVDVITGGNHSWDGPDVDKVFAYPEVVRPINLDERRGHGHVTVGTGEHELTVVNMLSPTAALPDMNAPQPKDLWTSWNGVRQSGVLHGSILVDMHGESPWEKASFVSAIDGQITALVGTHTHDPTLRGHILPNGTGYVTELGMTGRLGFTGGGFDPIHFATAFRGEEISGLPPYQLAPGPMALGAVLIDVLPNGTTSSITRIS